MLCCTRDTWTFLSIDKGGVVNLGSFGGLQRVGKEGREGNSVSNDRDLWVDNVSGCSIIYNAAIGPYHVEALACIFLCDLATCTVNAHPLSIVHGGLEYPGNGSVQIFVECAHDRTADVVS